MTYDHNKRWRQRNPGVRQEGKARYYARTQGAANGGAEWTAEEDARVLARDVTDPELSAEIGRSVGAIQGRRWRLNGGG